MGCGLSVPIQNGGLHCFIGAISNRRGRRPLQGRGKTQRQNLQEKSLENQLDACFKMMCHMLTCCLHPACPGRKPSTILGHVPELINSGGCGMIKRQTDAVNGHYDENMETRHICEFLTGVGISI
jgi:hypothetical protein